MTELRTPPSPNVLEVPYKQAEAFRKLASLPADLKSKIYSALAEIPQQLFPAVQVDFVLSSVLDGHELSAADLAPAIRSLISSRFYLSDRTDAEFVRAVVEGVAAQLGGVQNEAEIQSVVVNLLGLKNLVVSYRSAKILFDDANHMHAANITSQLRPVFDVTGSQIEAAVVSHVLCLDYSGNGEAQRFFLSLDDSDLDALEAAVQRARRKTIAMHGFASGAGLSLVGEGK
ncbi:hypothetical protein BV378_14305 [Nostoc sp. RF31YmG]|jgi:NAD(P)-dependent dehydrogenase (short-subunit alcohol dehydrogenase family)|nr:hypothetical protein BV378_14305 [Nostoc sp. RF31YmG]